MCLCIMYVQTLEIFSLNQTLYRNQKRLLAGNGGGGEKSTYMVMVNVLWAIVTISIPNGKKRKCEIQPQILY